VIKQNTTEKTKYHCGKCECQNVIRKIQNFNENKKLPQRKAHGRKCCAKKPTE
jgi:hypothetical protein